VVSVPVAALAVVPTDRGLILALHIWMLVGLQAITTASLQTLHMQAHGVLLDLICIQAMLAIAGNTYRILQLDR
jgi:hypothetical protein